MKRVMFIQLKGNSYGGIWQVIKLVGEKLCDMNYDVTVVSLRENHANKPIQYNGKMHLYTVNSKDIWERTYYGNEIKEALKKGQFLKVVKMLIIRIKHNISVLKDTKKLKKYITKKDPDYIVVNHYQLLEMIPSKYLGKTIHEQHSSFMMLLENNDNIDTLKKYNGKVKYLWLTKKTMEDATKYGYKDNYYIYNAVRFSTNDVANVTKNKKLVTIARLSKEKRIDRMIEVAEKIFKDAKYRDWSLEIYGTGEIFDELNMMIDNHKQIKLMGLTDNPQGVLLHSSINLNTSEYEGFALSIIEANECGVPTISLDTWESVNEEIINNKTGIIVSNMDNFQVELKKLMDDSNKLSQLSRNCKEFSRNFKIDNIIDEWIKLFDKIDK